jgi:hypothetical protein
MKFKLTHLAPVLAAGAAAAAIVAAPIASAATTGQSCGGSGGGTVPSRLGTFRSTTPLALSSSTPMGARPSCGRRRPWRRRRTRTPVTKATR